MNDNLYCFSVGLMFCSSLIKHSLIKIWIIVCNMVKVKHTFEERDCPRKKKEEFQPIEVDPKRNRKREKFIYLLLLL